MLLLMAAMSADDGLVLQMKQGDLNVSSDGSKPVDVSIGLKALLSDFGKNPAVSIVLCPDERMPLESLKFLSDSFPSLKIGAPDGFFNGLSSMQKILR